MRQSLNFLLFFSTPYLRCTQLLPARLNLPEAGNAGHLARDKRVVFFAEPTNYALRINLPAIFCNSAGISLAGNTKSTLPDARARKGMLLTSAVAS